MFFFLRLHSLTPEEKRGGVKSKEGYASQVLGEEGCQEVHSSFSKRISDFQRGNTLKAKEPTTGFIQMSMFLKCSIGFQLVSTV